MGAERRRGHGHRRLQRLGAPSPSAQRASGLFGNLGGGRGRRGPGDALQVPRRLAPGGLRGRQGRPVRVPHRAAATHRLGGVGSRLSMAGRGMAAATPPPGPTRPPPERYPIRNGAPPPSPGAPPRWEPPPPSPRCPGTTPPPPLRCAWPAWPLPCIWIAGGPRGKIGVTRLHATRLV